MAAVCIWTNMHQTVLFHTGQTVADKHWWGFLHTHLPMFWGQSSVEHHCCQRLLLHAHNNQIASRAPITGDATAAFFGTKITQQTIYNLIIRTKTASFVTVSTFESGWSSQYGVYTSINAIISSPGLRAAPITLLLTNCEHPGVMSFQFPK